MLRNYEFPSSSSLAQSCHHESMYKYCHYQFGNYCFFLLILLGFSLLLYYEKGKLELWTFLETFIIWYSSFRMAARPPICSIKNIYFAMLVSQNIRQSQLRHYNEHWVSFFSWHNVEHLSEELSQFYNARIVSFIAFINFVSSQNVYITWLFNGWWVTTLISSCLSMHSTPCQMSWSDK